MKANEGDEVALRATIQSVRPNGVVDVRAGTSETFSVHPHDVIRLRGGCHPEGRRSEGLQGSRVLSDPGADCCDLRAQLADAEKVVEAAKRFQHCKFYITKDCGACSHCNLREAIYDYRSRWHKDGGEDGD